MIDIETDVYNILKNLNINYEVMSHKPVYTSEEAIFITNKMGGIGVKNLFLKSKHNYYLVLIPENKRANIKYIESQILDGHLSFANDDNLKQILNLTPGSVTPFGIINDKENKVIIVIDEELINKKVLFHPNINTKTIKINYLDLIKFIEEYKHKYVVLRKEENYE